MLNYNHTYKIYSHPILDALGTSNTVDGCRVKINFNVTWVRPKYTSHAGIDYHVRGLEALGVPKGAAIPWVLDPMMSDEDIKFFFQYPNAGEQVGKHFHFMENPFNSKRDMSLIRRWVEKFSHTKIKLATYLSNHDIIDLRIPRICKNFLFDLSKDDRRKHDIPDWNERLSRLEKVTLKTETRAILMFVFGFCKPLMEEWFDGRVWDWCRNQNQFNTEIKDLILYLISVDRFFKEMKFDIETLDFSKEIKSKEYNVDFFSMGMKHSDFSFIWNLDLPRREKVNMIETFVKGGFGDIRALVTVKFNIDVTWTQYIKPHSGSPMFLTNLVRFILKHKAKFSKKRTLYGPNNQRIEMHYHNLIRFITPSILPDHKKGWDSVMGDIEEQQKEELKSRCKDPNEKVKPFPFKTTEVIKQLTTVGDFLVEGEVMDHCVLGYVDRAKMNTFIFHVGAPAPFGATAEVYDDGQKLVVAQVRGYKNDNGSYDCCSTREHREEDLINSYINSINEKKPTSQIYK